MAEVQGAHMLLTKASSTAVAPYRIETESVRKEVLRYGPFSVQYILRGIPITWSGLICINSPTEPVTPPHRNQGQYFDPATTAQMLMKLLSPQHDVIHRPFSSPFLFTPTANSPPHWDQFALAPFHHHNALTCVTHSSSCFVEFVTCYNITIFKETMQSTFHVMPYHKHLNIGSSSH
jgi:hypothetical protein